MTLSPTVTPTPGAAPRQRAPWRGVAIPSEHGGWGLTAEPILLGLVVAFSWPGLAAVAASIVIAILAFVQFGWMRHPFIPPAKVIGTIQMFVGFVVVAATAFGVLILG